MIIDFADALRAEISQRHSSLLEDVGRGIPQDYAAYKQLIGSLQAYEAVLQILEETTRKYIEDA